MKHEDLCQWTMETVMKQGASDCRVSLTRQRQVEIRYRMNRPESVKEATTRNLWLVLYANGRYTAQSTSDMRKTALAEFISSALANLRHMPPDPCRTLPPKAYIENQPQADLNLYDRLMAEMPIDSRHRLVASASQVCLDNGGDQMIHVQASVTFSERKNLRMSTNGFSVATTDTTIRLGASMTARDHGERKPAGYYFAGCRHINDLPEATDIGRQAAERTLNLLGAKKMPSETLPVIVENQVASGLLSSLVESLKGANIQQQRSFLADKKGVSIGGPALCLVDDPLIVKGLGSRLCDHDGLPSRPRTLVDRGRINSFLIDWYYSQKMKCEPTSGSVSNLTIPPGSRSIKEMMADVDRGILISDFIGGNTNPTTGDFSMGIFGQLFEKGQPVQAIAEMNIADNHLNFWKKLAAMGNDPWTYGKWRIPSLLFTDVMVAGI